MAILREAWVGTARQTMDNPARLRLVDRNRFSPTMAFFWQVSLWLLALAQGEQRLQLGQVLVVPGPPGRALCPDERRKVRNMISDPSEVACP